MALNPYADPGLLQRILRRVVGREREARAILAALAAGRNVLLQGPPGTSKSTLLRAIAEESGVDFFIVEGTADLTPQKLVGTFNPAKVMAEGFKPEFFEPGPLTRAMERGGLLYIEEFNRMSEEAANVLIRAAEEREISIPRLGVVRAKPSFRIVCAMNPYDDVGTSKVSRALLDRFVMLRMDYQSRGEEVEIVKLRSGSKRQWLVEIAVDLARATRQHPAVKMGASIRGAIDMVTIAEQLIAMRGAVSLEDLTTAAIMAFSPKIWMRDPSKSPEELIEEILQSLLAKRRQELSMESPSELRDEEAGDGERVGRRGDGRDLLDKLSRMADLAPRRAALMVVNSPELLDAIATEGLRGLDVVARILHHIPPSLREIARRYARDLVLRAARSSSGRRGLTRKPLKADFLDIDVEASVEKVLEACRLTPDEIMAFTRGRRGRAYALIIDRSSSMAGFKLVLGALVGATLAYASDRVDDYCVLAFNTSVDVIKPFKIRRRAEDVVDEILTLEAEGYTDIHRALLSAYSLMREAGYEPRAVLVTDGEWTAGSNPLDAAPLFSRLDVICVPSKWRGFARALAELGHGAFAFIRSMSEVPDKLMEVLNLD